MMCVSYQTQSQNEVNLWHAETNIKMCGGCGGRVGNWIFLATFGNYPCWKIGFNSYLLTTHKILVYTFVYIYPLSSVCQL